MPKKNDKIILDNLKNNIVKIYIIGKRINFFKKQIKIEIDYQVTRNLKNSLTNIFKDIRISNRKENIILLSPHQHRLINLITLNIEVNILNF